MLQHERRHPSSEHRHDGVMTSPARAAARTSFAPARVGRPDYDPTHFLLTMLWSADPAVVRQADEAGVDRIGLDLEVIGKAERQKNLPTWVSQHHESQLPALRAVLRRGQLFCRTNPIHEGSKREIDRLIEHGVEVLMLPFFRTVEEPQRFADLVASRATTVLLVEHCDAARKIEQLVRIPGVDEIHVGLTDLSLSLKVPNRFALMASPLVERIAQVVRASGMRFAVGGIGRAMDDSQPIPTDLIYSQYHRLGATGALISRAFFPGDGKAGSLDVATEIRRCRERMEHWRTRSADELQVAKDRLIQTVGSCKL